MKQNFNHLLPVAFLQYHLSGADKREDTKLPPPIIDVHFHTFKITPGEKMDYRDVYAPKSQAEYEKELQADLHKYNMYVIASGDDSVLQTMKQREPERVLTSKIIWSPKAVDMDQLRQEIKDKKVGGHRRITLTICHAACQ